MLDWPELNPPFSKSSSLSIAYIKSSHKKKHDEYSAQRDKLVVVVMLVVAAHVAWSTKFMKSFRIVKRAADTE